jgi:hypothetical protein
MNHENEEAWDSQPITYRCRECGERFADERDAKQCAYYDRNPAALAAIQSDYLDDVKENLIK